MRCVLAMSVLVGCGSPPVDAVFEPEPTEGIGLGRVVTEVLLVGVPPSRLVGVAVDPDDGAWHVLDAQEGLFVVTEDGLESVARPTDLLRDGIDDLRPYTDVVSLGNDRFSVTVPNDGLLLDVATGTTAQHFCYVPGNMPLDGLKPVDDPVDEQVTQGVAFDPEAGLLFAQPQTFRDSVPTAASIGSYDVEDGGQPTEWYDLREAHFVAGGMVWSDGRLLLGSGSVLYRYAMGSDQPVPYADLGHLGVGDIQGLAVDASGHLIVADGARMALVEIADWAR